LNTDFEINNERQDYKIGIVGVGTCGMGRVKGRDEDEGI
jgi:hypothetical protein